MACVRRRQKSALQTQDSDLAQLNAVLVSLKAQQLEIQSHVSRGTA